MNTLLTWLGTKDIEHMQTDNVAAVATLALKANQPFDKIVILANQHQDKWHDFERFLKKRLATLNRPNQDIHIHRASIISPIDYDSIARLTRQWIDRLSEEADTLSINLTSGTPTMTALSILIGKGKTNVRFLQTTPKNEIQTIEIPLDFAQEYVRSASKNLAHNAVVAPKLANAFNQITAKSNTMQKVINKAQRISTSEVPALILGATGTGKEMMAQAIHKASLRASKPIKTVNCGALALNLVDSTLFGHKKGAFTGAEKDYPGLFEQADGGTLFLDEIGELSLDIQVKLLRALQQGEINRLGDTKTTRVDVRVITATHQNLLKLVEAGRFREDLFYRLAVGVIDMPSLAERSADIPLIVEELTAQINQSASKHPDYISKYISEKGINFLVEQNWPGNIRELWSTLNRAFLWADNQIITPKDLQDAMISKPNTMNKEIIELSYHDKVNIVQLTDNYQKKYIESALKASGNVKKHATQMLGLKDHQTLTNWMKRLGIEPLK